MILEGTQRVQISAKWLMHCGRDTHCYTVEDWTECAPIHLNGRNNVLFTEKCIRLACEKLTIFLYGQDIVGNVDLLAFWRYS